MTESNQDQPGAETEAEAAESQADLRQGALPVEARKRLQQETAGRPLFATGLSVGEFLLAGAEGYDAAGVVLGSSIYHVGWQYSSWFSGELTVLTHAHMTARMLAMGRMQQEASQLGAHGVIGVRLTTRDYEWGPDLLEFTATGTAVRLRGAPAAQTPFLSDLSGEDFWTLVQAGYEPRGLAMGFCAYSVYGSRGMYSFGNQELTDYTAAVYESRRLAMTRLQGDLTRMNATGAVGVKVETTTRYIEGGENQSPRLVVEFFALGTAIAPSPNRGLTVAPSTVLNMTGLRPVRPRLEAAELQHK